MTLLRLTHCATVHPFSSQFVLFDLILQHTISFFLIHVRSHILRRDLFSSNSLTLLIRVVGPLGTRLGPSTPMCLLLKPSQEVVLLFLHENCHPRYSFPLTYSFLQNSSRNLQSPDLVSLMSRFCFPNPPVSRSRHRDCQPRRFRS